MENRTFIKIFGLVVFFLLSLFIQPHICRAESVFGFSEDILMSFEQQEVLVGQQQSESIYTENRNPVVKTPDITYTEGTSLGWDINKGQIFSKYNLLSPRFINLILYHKQDLSGADHIYTIEAQSQLGKALTVSYGYDAINNRLRGNRQLDSTTMFTAQNAGVKVNLFPGVFLKADYKKELYAIGSNESRRSFNLAYNPGSFASISAGYGVISSMAGTVPKAANTAAFMGTESQGANLEDLVVKELGISIFPTNYSSISAGYVTLNEKGEANNTTSTATFGLKFGANKTEFNATYQMRNEDNAITTHSAGLELGLVDLAHLRAVYSKTEEHQVLLADLKSTVDLGLNVNFADNSALNFQYKLVLPDSEPSEEQRAEATLEIRF